MSSDVAVHTTIPAADLRERRVIENVYAEALSIRSAMARHGDINPQLRHVDGILATLGWALGRSLASPLSQRPPDSHALQAEKQLAAAQLHHSAECEPCDRSYLIAVRDTLHWLTGATDTPPF